MTLHRLFASKLAFALVVLALLCAVSARPHAHAGATQAPSVLDLATAWSYALKRSDVRRLDNASDYPFELRLAKAPCSCKEGKAQDAAQLGPLLAELMKSAEVQAIEVTSGDVKEIPKALLPSWAKRWSKGLAKGARLVLVESSGSAASALTFVLVVKDDRVRAIWLNADGGS